VPGTQHFRNILRHDVKTEPDILTLRIDESLWFANASFLENHISRRLADDAAVRHVILMFTAVNEVDLSALESLEALNRALKDAGVTLHLSEVKGPVMDRLQRSHLLDQLSGDVFFSQWDAWSALSASATCAWVRHCAGPALGQAQ
jgi:SulP family sulfate permease